MATVAGIMMKKDNGYTFDILRSGIDFMLYRGRADGAPSVLAIGVAEQQGSGRNYTRLTHEKTIAGELDRSWAALPLAFTRHEGVDLLLIEDGGEPLDIVLNQREALSDLTWSLQVAENLADAVSQMHKHGLVHRDIKPANVLLDVRLGVRLTGFGFASSMRSERRVPTPPTVNIAGTLAYMAPEQTGRMNRSIDSRSDLYSLGVCLYELFSGALPFTASEPAEWMHCHIARKPLPPSARSSGLPPMIDAIVMKLLAKNPEDRYQTAAGVAADFHQCLESLAALGEIGAFPVGRRDVSDQLLIPEKLYGREPETEVLFAAANRASNEGTCEIVFVSGYSGVGKSSFVNELPKILLPSHGLFASGKFDQYKRDIPYWTLALAFQGLVRQLLSKSDAELASWRDELLSALGPNGQLMVNLIPELALVIGDQPPTTQVDPQSAQARFRTAFRSLLGVFTKPEHPLVLFIDDLQWMDTATLELLKTIMTDEDAHHLMIVGAYRDNEVDASHPLSVTIDAIHRSGASISEIKLKPLQVVDLSQLFADALNSNVSQTTKLAELVIEKTAGNPFFAIQFLTALAEEGLLTFAQETLSWQWEIDRIRARRITDNVAEFMSTKLNRLPSDTKTALGQLACLGNFVDVRIISHLLGGSEVQVQATLRQAEEAGLIVRANDSVAFLHDRVQEAAYALIPRMDRPSAHLTIARMLLAIVAPTELDEKIFEIVNQFERGKAALESSAERTLVAELNLKAGTRAKGSSAYAAAQAYFSAGRTLLEANSWDICYQLTFDFELQLAECEIVGSELVAAEDRLTALSLRAIGLVDQADVVCLAVLLYFTTGRSERAVEVALEFLARIGITWSPRPSEDKVQHEYVEMRSKLAILSKHDVINLPSMTDPTCIAAMAVLTELFPAAYATDRYLLELVLLRMTNLSLAHGNCESSSVAYSALNMSLGSHFGDYSTAFTLGEVACQLVDRRVADRYQARVYSCFAAFTMPWMKHLPLCRPMMIDSFEIGRSMGDKAFATYNARNLITHLLVSGVALDEVQRECEQALLFAQSVALGMPADCFFGQLDLVRKLQGLLTEDRRDYDSWASQEVDGHPGLAMMVSCHWVFKLQERYFGADLVGALEAAKRVEGVRWTLRSTIEEAEYDFYAALAMAATIDIVSAKQRSRKLQVVRKHYERICAWAANCPENFAGRQALVGAEIARLERREFEAEQLYEQAVLLARDHGFLQVEALANELAGEFYSRRGLQTVALAYLRNARDCYERWGGKSKINQLDSRYPQLRPRPTPSSRTNTIDAPLAQLDVEAVDRASQALSSEMVLPSLLEKLMRLSIEHSGAERGLLILLHDGEPHIEATATTRPGSVEVFVGRSRATQSDLPLSALQYVLRTRDRLVLGDAFAKGLDLEDGYLLQNKPRSVLCLPIFKKNEVIGVLYLENNLVTRAFTSERVAVLDLLASQAAIWLENARLYSDLKRSEASLRETQRLSLTGSWYWRLSDDTIEFSEQTYRIYELDPTIPVSLEAIAGRFLPEDLPIMEEMVQLARGPAADLDHVYRARMPDFTIKHLHLVAHGTKNKDGELIYMGAIQDITARHQAEAALSRARSELAHVTRVTTLGVLTASIAHEVNQPLLGVVTNASTCLKMLAAEPPDLEGARRNAERSRRDGHRAADVIKRLRALFGKKGTTTELVDINDAAREVAALSASELQRGGVIPQLKLAPGLPLVMGDRVQLQQVILNLLLNAFDAMKDIYDRPRQLVVITELSGNGNACLTVKDVGVGLDAETIERLFDAFYTTKSDGMGMGLSVSRYIVESHGGRLWATPNDGPGSTFTFSIPPASSDMVAGSNLDPVLSAAPAHRAGPEA
jgi:predicted ATPase/signal transduction histidine kinase